MQKERIAVVDCDNFFVSCERSQDESLMGKAVCVMGNNDGCVIARSNEAKKLGLPMGYPYFKAKLNFLTLFICRVITLYILKFLIKFLHCLKITLLILSSIP